MSSTIIRAAAALPVGPRTRRRLRCDGDQLVIAFSCEPSIIAVNDAPVIEIPTRFTLPEDRPLRVLSLGAGVQSTVLLLMGARREIIIDGQAMIPDLAIFADTQWEPAEVYRHLRWLREEIIRIAINGGALVPIFDITRGNIRQNAIDVVEGRRKSAPNIPLYLRNPDGTKGRGRRQCTVSYKIEQVDKRIRQLVGRKRLPHRSVEKWIGISMDEIIRMKPSTAAWATHTWPLIDLGMSRHDCEKWLAANGYPPAPKSACIGCPHRSNASWRHLKDTAPADFADAVAFDHAIRRYPGLHGLAYLHADRVPLDEVDLTTAIERGQDDLFAEECTGMCGN